MFGRRTRLRFHHRLWRLVWPRGGWWRFSSYLAHRIRRLPGTPHSIAAGVAAGVAVSFTPFMGLHFLLACGLAYLLRGNLVAAAVGTAAGNPWTFPLIWTWSYGLGRWLLGDAGAFDMPGEVTIDDLAEDVAMLLWPMTVGGLPTAATAFAATYYPVRRMVASYQAARQRRLRRRRRPVFGRRKAKEGPAQGAEFRMHRVRSVGSGRPPRAVGADCPTARRPFPTKDLDPAAS